MRATTENAYEEVSVTEVAGSVYELPSTKAVIRYLHSSLGFPTKSTLLNAIKHGNLTSFPRLTTSAVAKYFPESDETQKGHMRQTRQGVRSMKEKPKQLQLETKDNVTRPTEQKKDVYVKVFDATNRQCTATKQTDSL